MKKIGLFVCDIMRTFTSREGNDKKLTDLRQCFINKLEQIRVSKELDLMIFSFSTSDDDIEYLFEKVNALKPLLVGTKVVLGSQFMSKGILTPTGKQFQKLIYINKISEINSQITRLLMGKFEEYDGALGIQEDEEVAVPWVGYADDRLNPSDIAVLKQTQGDDVAEIYGFIPGAKATNVTDLISRSTTDNLEGTVQCIENSLKKELMVFGEAAWYEEELEKRKQSGGGGFFIKPYPNN